MRIKTAFTAILGIFVFQNVFSQPVPESQNIVSIPVESNQQLLLNGRSRLYNGFDYRGYPHKYFSEGHQFFGGDNFIVGNVVYEGITYRNVPILYDLVNDELVIEHFDKVSRINLIKSKVQEFSFGNHTFIKVEAEQSANHSFSKYYEKLYSGSVTLLADRQKKITESISGGKITHTTYQVDRYFTYKAGKLHSIKNQGSLLEILEDRKPEIQKYLKSNQLKFKKDPETVMVKIAAYYDEITK